MPQRSLVIVGHGSRVDNRAFEGCVTEVAQALPSVKVRGAYLEFATPSVDEALSEAAQSAAASAHGVLVLPLFLFEAGHLKHDLPACITRARSQWPAVDFRIAGAIGQEPSLLDLCALRFAAAGPPGVATADLDVLVVGRGASDEDATGAFQGRVQALRSTLAVRSVSACYLAAQEPAFETALEGLVTAGSRGIVVLPFLLFPGKLTERIARFAQEARWQGRCSVAAPLGGDQRFASWIAERAQSLLCWSFDGP